MRKQLAFITALMALTLGVGIFAGARQSTDSTVSTWPWKKCGSM